MKIVLPFLFWSRCSEPFKYINTRSKNAFYVSLAVVDLIILFWCWFDIRKFTNNLIHVRIVMDGRWGGVDAVTNYIYYIPCLRAHRHDKMYIFRIHYFRQLITNPIKQVILHNYNRASQASSFLVSFKSWFHVNIRYVMYLLIAHDM